MLFIDSRPVCALSSLDNRRLVTEFDSTSYSAHKHLLLEQFPEVGYVFGR